MLRNRREMCGTPILSTCELGLDPDSGWRHRPRPLLGIDLPDYIPDLLALTWAIRSTLSPPLAPAGGAFVPWDKGGMPTHRSQQMGKCNESAEFGSSAEDAVAMRLVAAGGFEPSTLRV